jgi:hypothetical protein
MNVRGKIRDKSGGGRMGIDIVNKKYYLKNIK